MKRETFVDILIEIRDLLFTQKEILTLNDLCNYTGYEKSYIYKLTSRRKIPHYKTPGGKSIFFKKDEIDDWLTQIKVKSVDEIKFEANNKIKDFYLEGGK